MKNRLFTKSAFKKALECPTKLFYYKKSKEYENEDKSNDFLRALARGGFQVGELARRYHPDGVLVETLDADEAIKQTEELLKKDKVVIFEAAFKFQDYFIRVDVIRKNGNICELLEVKSKSADPSEFADLLWDKRSLKKNVKSLTVKWYDYIYDVAFQTYVCRQARPDLKINPYLVCADKTKRATVDGLNQKFLIRDTDTRDKVEIKGDVSLKGLGEPILCELDVSEPVNVILEDKEMSEKLDGLQFNEAIKIYSEKFVKGQKISPIIGKQCKACEFRCEDGSLKSGFHECWQEAAKLAPAQLSQPLAYDVWNFLRADDLIKNKRFFLKDLNETDITIKPNEDGTGLSRSERQWLQVKMAKEGNEKEFIDVEGLSLEMANWKYPLHFIDFETCMVAIPFVKGRRPYEQVAFQYSHHIVYEDGRIEHKSQYLNAKPGHFPNFDFVRALKKDLEGDSGTIFRYHNHENTVLNQIRDQLMGSAEPDKDALIKWIESVTSRTKDKWVGPRSMVDLCEMEILYYYNPATHGSNSIKQVLPSVLSSSKYLQNKYSKPIYGKHGEILSHNFDSQKWIEFKDGKIIDPYKSLPKVFNDYDRETLDILFSDDDLADGGAAMTAYCYLQFSEMSEKEREKIQGALLKYCELDTLAMVMLWEHWNELIKKEQKAKLQTA